MNQKVIILGIVILAVVGIGGYAIFNKTNPANNIPSASQNMPTPTTQQVPVGQQPTPIAQTHNSETAGWKIYKNTKYGFEVRYPQDWEIFEMLDKQKYGREGITLDSPARRNFEEDIHTPSDMNMVIEEKNSQISLDKFIEQYSDGWYSRYAAEEFATIGGKNARYVKSSDYRPANVIFIDNGHYVLIIPFNLDETYPDMPNLATYKSIINTIRFTN